MPLDCIDVELPFEEVMPSTDANDQVVALDLFAGAGGWSVACRRLGIKEYGVEFMDAAIQTREANGFNTEYKDVWDGLFDPSIVPEYSLLIASPPCQGYSLAGKGSGRKALDDVLRMIAEGAYADPHMLKDFAAHGVDDRDVLVLSPLAYIYRDGPQFVALEQVPAVLPVWEEYAKLMRTWGYSVDVANIQAETLGVPQTRKRAILVARLDGGASEGTLLPTPTHSKYHSRTPEKLDPGVKPWVSMHEALGGAHQGARYTQNNKMTNQSRRPLDQPAVTVTAGHDSGNRGFVDDAGFKVATPDEVARLQSFPKGAGS